LTIPAACSLGVHDTGWALVIQAYDSAG